MITDKTNVSAVQVRKFFKFASTTTEPTQTDTPRLKFLGDLCCRQ